MTTTKLITANQLLMMPDDGFRYELVRGGLSEKMPPPGDGHGDVTGRFAVALGRYCEDNDYGVIRDNAGFYLESGPDTVRAPGLAWIAPGRIEGFEPGYRRMAPDLAVEIKSPSDTPSMVAERAQMWLDFGSHEVWYGDPERTTVTRYRPGEEPQILGEDDMLDGGDLLPGFSVPVWRLFRRHH
jgi:Uma2 family endonuclease